MEDYYVAGRGMFGEGVYTQKSIAPRQLLPKPINAGCGE